ncbi:hypothetical protein EK904_013336, partial [Melospiza melodia maxima]
MEKWNAALRKTFTPPRILNSSLLRIYPQQNPSFKMQRVQNSSSVLCRVVNTQSLFLLEELQMKG